MVLREGFKSLIALTVLFTALLSADAQTAPEVRSQEVSDADGVPVLIRHLPDWEKVRSRAGFFNSSEGLKYGLENRPVLDLIDFAGGTEAAAADYPAGKLLIVEFSSPQGSIDADAKILQQIAASPVTPPVVYRRIGNYNAFVFDAADAAAANALLDEVKYQKTVQWLGDDPYLLRRMERYFVNTTRDIFVSTVLWIIGGLGLSILLGIIAGIFFFRFREQKRATRTAYSDAGGLTRLNLDGLSE